MKLGIFGGTFNPPHNTHRDILLQAVCQLGLDKVLVVPCGDPPHKSCSVDKRARLEMARLAFEGFAEIFTYEIDKQGKSYTLDTLTEVKRLYPSAELYLIIGGDSLADFSKWHCPEQIARMCTLTVAQRGEQKLSYYADRLSYEYGAQTEFWILSLIPSVPPRYVCVMSSARLSTAFRNRLTNISVKMRYIPNTAL